MSDQEIVIGAKTIGAAGLFFTVEEGMANLGSYAKALSMIDAAATTGADAIEFQFVIADDLYGSKHPRFEFCKSCEFATGEISDLARYTKRRCLEFIAAPLSHKLVEPLVDAGCAAFNINASDVNNPQIIDAVMDSGLPFFLSSLLATEDEIDWAVNRVSKGSSRFGILHGQHTMLTSGCGVDAAQTALGYLSTLKNRYQVLVGFIDHTQYEWMPAAAVSAGADVITKHLALRRSDRGPDWQVCLEPDEMTKAVSWARAIRESVKPKHKTLAPGEELDRRKMRRSVVAARSLKSGDVIAQGDIEFKRPGTGIEPSKYEDVIGRIVTTDYEKDDLIQFEGLE